MYITHADIYTHTYTNTSIPSTTNREQVIVVLLCSALDDRIRFPRCQFNDTLEIGLAVRTVVGRLGPCFQALKVEYMSHTASVRLRCTHVRRGIAVRIFKAEFARNIKKMLSK